MHVLVTGASGFVGRRVCSGLIDAGNAVTPVSRKNGIDVTNWDNIQRLGPADVVCHLAGTTGKGGSSRETYTVNWLGTLHILEYSRIHKVRAVVVASSYIYGPAQYLPVDEAHPLLGQGEYAKSKILSEELCRTYAEEYGLSVVGLRVFNAYGPGQRDTRVIPTVLSQLTRGGEVVLRDASPRRDFVYIDDVAEAFLLAMRSETQGFRAYNVASGESVSVEDIVREIIEAWGTSFPITYTGERRDNEIMDSAGNNDLIAEALGWKPKVPLQEGIRRTVEWWR